MDYLQFIRANIQASIAAKQAFLSDAAQMENFGRAVAMIVASYKRGGRLYIAGNGGSAADAQHLAAEFVSKLARPRGPLPAEALTVDTSALTAIGNDYGFDQVFSRQIEGKMTKNDIFLGITTSGNSPNILKAFDKCREMGVPGILLGGHGGGKARALADCSMIAPGEMTSTIQEVHGVIYHSLCGAVEEELIPSGR